MGLGAQPPQASRAQFLSGKVTPSERAGFLWRSQVGAMSAARFAKASEDFRLWVCLRLMAVGTLEELDCALERYFGSLYIDGLQVHVGRQTLYWEVFIRQTSFRAADRMVLAKGALKGWARRSRQLSPGPDALARRRPPHARRDVPPHSTRG